MKRLTALFAAATLAATAAAARTAKPVVPSPSARIDRAEDRLIARTDFYWHKGDYDSVVFLYSVVVDMDPQNVEAWQDYGWIMWAGQLKDDAAMRIFLRGAAANPDRYELYFEAGNLEYHRRRFLSAAQWLAKATDRNAPWTVWHQRAHCLEYAGEVTKCKAVWKECIRRFPKDDIGRVNLKRVEAGRLHTNAVVGVEPVPGHPSAPQPKLDDETPKGPQQSGSI